MGFRLVGVTVLVCAGLIAAGLGAYGASDEGLVVVLRATALLSLGLFLSAFVASSVNRLTKSAAGKWLMRNRKVLGVSFAVAHYIHLGLIATRATMYPSIFFVEKPPLKMIPGATAYAFIAAMAITSFEAPAKALGRKRWKRLHKVGVYVVWALFMAAFATRMERTPADVVGLVVLLGALALRIAAAAKARAKSPK